MTDQTPANGRVTTRDLLAAVQGSEERVTNRIDRLESNVNRRLDGHGARLSAVENEQAEERGFRTKARAVIVTAVAIAALVLPYIIVNGGTL